MLLSLGACLVFERRFGAEGKKLAGKRPVRVELWQAWEFLGYQFNLVKARQTAVQILLL